MATERPGTILAVEDEPLNRRLLHAVLDPAGYRLVDAGSLADARTAVVGVIPDLVLLDLRLPDGDGLTFARELKGRPETAHVPVVIATASAMAPTREAAENAGCDGFLIKPIRPGDLLAEVRRHLQRDRRASDGVP